MRIIFMGTPEFAVPSLALAIAHGHDIAAVYSQPPRRAGRGKRLTPSPVHSFAQDAGIEVRTPVSLKGAEEQAAFAALEADVALVAAYGLILPQPILDAPRLGCVNVHASLLPRWRGAAPVQRAILAGDETTGVTIMQMEAGLDTGPMLLTRETPVGAKTAGELTEELAELGAVAAAQWLLDPAGFTPFPQPDEGVTYASKIDKAEAKLDFSASAEAVLRQVRGFNPAPGAFFEHEGERYRVHEAERADASGAPDAAPGTVLDHALTIACGPDGSNNATAIRPTVVQRAGKPRMATADLLRGRPIAPGTVLDSTP